MAESANSELLVQLDPGLVGDWASLACGLSTSTIFSQFVGDVIGINVVGLFSFYDRGKVMRLLLGQYGVLGKSAQKE